MTAPPRDAPATRGASAADPTSETDLPRHRARALWGWLAIAVLVLAVALVSTRFAATSPAARGALDPEGYNESGAAAIAEVLRQQGIEVTVVRSRDEARSALRAGPATLALADPFVLSDEAVRELVAPAHEVVFLSSSSRLLRLFDLGADAPAPTDGPRPPGCAVAAFAGVGEVVALRQFEPAPGVTGCFSDAEGAAAVLVDDRSAVRYRLVEGADLFSNASVADDGNAALALALLGQHPRLVWYVPSFDDGDVQADPADTLGSATPDWVSPAILLLLAAGLAAAVARGRRFGPLVSENLPVTVRASETMHGRARLTARAADAAHAAAALRSGAAGRLARRLGLSAAMAQEAGVVADAAAERLGVARDPLRALLSDGSVHTDADLIDIARGLDDLERAVDAAVRAERRSP